MAQFGEFVVNNLLLFTLLGVILALLAWNLSGGLGGAQAVEPGEATRLINREDARVLDIRPAAEYEQGHILNAIHVPAGELEQRLKQLDKHRQRPVIVVCRSGATSTGACATLAKAGFEKVYSLKGGIMAWQNANLPLTKD